MRWVLRATVGACAALVLVACSSDGGTAVTATTVVEWADYEPSLQATIDAMAVAQDCDGMQLKFNEIGGTNLAERNKFGHGNEAVLTYIDAKERAADCFPTAATTTTIAG